MSEESLQRVESQPKVTDSDFKSQWWAELDPYHRKKVQYLGRVVDCSNPMTYKEWWKLLDANDLDPVRKIADGAKNLDVNPTTSTDTVKEEREEESRIQADSGATVAPYKGIKVGSGFHLERQNTASTKTSMKYKPTTTITFLQDTSKDLPNDITGADDTHHTKFETELCGHILQEIEIRLREKIEEIVKEMEEKDAELTEVKERLESVKSTLDKLLKDKADPSVTKFENFISKSSDPQEDFIKWSMVANACTSYINRKQFRRTHYVHCITLGTTAQESEITESKAITKSGKGELQGLDYVDTKVEVESKTFHKSKSTATLTRGTEDKQEVIAITTRAVSDLISSQSPALLKLRGVMEMLIGRHNTIDKGEEAGPFHIYCSKKKILGKATKIYWRVVEGSDSPEILGTTKSNDASHFYIKHVKRSGLGFYIVHKPDLGNPLYVAVKRPFYALSPLQLWSATDDGTDQDICFTRESPVQSDDNNQSFPNTTDEWTRQGPIFIKLPYGVNWFQKNERYVGMQENGNTYKTISNPKRPKEQKERDMWLFSFENAPSHGALGGPPPPPSTEKQDDSDDIINWPDDGEVVDHAQFYELVGEDYMFPFQVISPPY